MRAISKALLVFSLMCGVSGAKANCLGDAAASVDELAKFKANIGAYVAGMSNSILQQTISKMAATDSGTLPVIVQYLKNAPLTSQTAMSYGLGEAAKSCQVVNEGQARDIQLAVVDLPVVLTDAFNRTAGLRTVGLAGASTGSSSGASGGQINAFGSSTATNSGTTFPTQYSTNNGATSGQSLTSSGPTLSRTTTNTFVTNTFVTNIIAPNPVSP